MMTTKITYVEDYASHNPDAEAVRQLFSAIGLIRDRMQEVELEHPWTQDQEDRFATADDLLARAHKVLRGIGRALTPAGAEAAREEAE